MKKQIILLLVVVVLGLAAASQIYLRVTQKPAESIDKIQERSGFPVKIYVVYKQDLQKKVAISGAIKGFKEVSIAATITERIKEIHVGTGQAVEAGELLVTLDDKASNLNVARAQASLVQAQQVFERLWSGYRQEEKEIARSSMAQAQADLVLKQLEYERQQQLYEEEATSLQRLQQGRANFDNSQALLEGARANYEMIEAGYRKEDIQEAQARVQLAEVAVAQANKDLEDHYLKAPFAGVTSLRLLETGDVAEMNKPIFQVLDVSRVYLDIDVSELYVTKIAVGMEVEVKVDSLEERDFSGTIGEINPIANVSDRSYVTRIVINNDDGLLKSGMFARAKIVTDQVKEALLVPADAIKGAGSQQYVFTVDDSNVVQKNDVTTGMTFDNMVEVVEGLEVQAKVITLGANIEAGVKVNIADEVR